MRPGSGMERSSPLIPMKKEAELKGTPRSWGERDGLRDPYYSRGNHTPPALLLALRAAVISMCSQPLG